MPTHLREDLNKRINDTSKRIGVSKKELIDRAIVFYLDSVQHTMKLKEELDAWDVLSDEVLKFSEQTNFKRK